MFADIALALDSTPPEINNTSPLIGTTGDTFSFEVNISDLSGIASVVAEVTYPDATTENITLTGSSGVYTGQFTLLEDDLTHIQYSLRVVDVCGNENHTEVFKINMFDNDAPDAVAVGAGTYNQGDTVDFSAWASTDNIEVVFYEWSFDYSGSPVVLNDMNFSFEFLEEGFPYYSYSFV